MGCCNLITSRGYLLECTLPVQIFTTVHLLIQGTFSDQKSLTQKCTRCTPCKNDEEMYVDCTPSSNYKCRPKIITSTTATEYSMSSTTLKGMKNLFLLVL